MKIEFKPEHRIHDIKKQFHELFPYLKVEFFKGSSGTDAGSSKAAVLDNNSAFADLIDGFSERTYEFEAAMPVGQFEKNLSASIGLQVQVFRKSGDLYLETSSTDDWTLAQQNEEAKNSQVHKDREATDLTDRDKWE